jgi:hypothetical protein
MLFGSMPIRHANYENNVLDLAHAKDIWSPSMGDCLGGPKGWRIGMRA